MTTIRTIALITSIAKASFPCFWQSKNFTKTTIHAFVGGVVKGKEGTTKQKPTIKYSRALFQNEKHVDENLKERNSSWAIARGQSPAGFKG